MITKIYLIRHGRTNVNETEQKPADPLSDLGKIQISETAHRLGSVNGITAIYTSTYQRAIESGKLIAQAINCQALTHDVSINEIGVWTSPLELHTMEKNSQAYDQALNFLTQAQDKAVIFLRHIAQTHPGETVVVVCHGNIIRAMVAEAILADIETTVRLEVEHASVTLLEYDTSARVPFFRLRLFNSTDRLP